VAAWPRTALPSIITAEAATRLVASGDISTMIGRMSTSGRSKFHVTVSQSRLGRGIQE